ncbi:hypothetical protein KO506_08295 [Polaribacter vadi]|uniref:hypothetical protein n=1 Tax=Polaribacter TaxID=52959 RepID=UPI001C0817CC|nr:MULTISPECIES: hypothetical protein [Polaribacter]MBU3011399.1 hypothetical protein [Polaribacter vadi]MDO6741211.1 hypothetical protein [Polaribacter sp. 1_MG-2023]
MTFRKNTLKIITSFFVLTLLFSSCASHQRSNIPSNENFVVELTKPKSRGSLVDTAIEGLFMGAKYLVDNSTKKLINTYTNSISINDYYNNFSGEIAKTYTGIQLKKYANPIEAEQKAEMKSIMTREIKPEQKSRGIAKSSLIMEDIFPKENEDLLNFHAVINFESDKDNPGVTRLSFNELRVFFSKTKVFKDENLNARVLISIEGQWRSTDGSPQTATLIEQEYDFKNIKYGYENQIDEPILTKWYYDIPIFSELEENATYGVIKVNVQLEEYEGNKSKYLNKLPSILSDNKSAIIKNGSSTINKIVE